MEPIEPMDLEAGGANRLHAPVVLSRVVNPFAMKPYRWTLAQKAKLLVCGLTLFPIRLLLLLVATPLMALLAMAVTVGAAPDRPLSTPRRLLLQPIRPAARLALWCFGYWWVHVERRPGSGGAAVIVSNHRSNLDFLFFAAADLPCFLAKADVATMPCLGRSIPTASRTLIAPPALG